MSETYVNNGRFSKYIITKDDSGPWIDKETGKRYKVISDSSIWVGGEVKEIVPNSKLRSYYFMRDGVSHPLCAFKESEVDHES
jgi:hypothetical protein